MCSQIWYLRLDCFRFIDRWTFSLCPHMVEGRKEKRFLSGFFYKGNIHSQGLHTFDLITSQRPYLQIPTYWKLSFDIWILWGTVHSVYGNISLFSFHGRNQAMIENMHMICSLVLIFQLFTLLLQMSGSQQDVLYSTDRLPIPFNILALICRDYAGYDNF